MRKCNANIACADINVRRSDIVISINRTPDSPLISELRAEIEALDLIAKKYDDVDAHIQAVVEGMGVMTKKYITQAGYDALTEKKPNVMYVIVN